MMETTAEMKLAAAREKMALLREARQTVTKEVERLMEHNESDGLSWVGTTTDLMEALYCAFEEQSLTDDCGLPLSFMTIVKHCCVVLHVKMPRNPYNMAKKGKNRKGIKKQSIISRTTHMPTTMSTQINYCTYEK